VALPAFHADRRAAAAIDAAGRSAANPRAAACGQRMMGQTDRRTPDRYKDPASGSREKLKWETLRAEPITPGVLTISVNMRQ